MNNRLHPRALLCSLLTLAPLAAQETDPAEVLRANTLEHYERVESELRQAKAPLSAATLARREQVLDYLHEYRTKAVFGVNAQFPGWRMPHFVDASGRRCAVAYLLDHTGHGHLTDRVAKHANHAWVADLAADAELQNWLTTYGLTLAEAARIQGPGGWGGSRARFRDETPPEPPPPPPVYDGPADRSRPAPTATSPRPARTRPAVGATTRRTPVRTSTAPRGIATVTLQADAWMPWFDLQSSRWFGPRDLPVSTVTTTAAPSNIDLIRKRAIARCREAAKDSNATVRAAAAQTLGRLGVAGEDARTLLKDAAYAVRLKAMVGLAQGGTARSIHPLLSLATTENQLQPMAMAAMGASGRRDASVERAVTRVLKNATSPVILAGAAAHERLINGDTKPATMDLARNGDTTTVRSLASTALGNNADAATIAALTTALSSPGLPARRAAAAALGRSRDALALPSLLSAFEYESDLGTRMQLLLAIGEHGGAAAKPFLLTQMRKGKKPLRAWAAAALGIWGRGAFDAKLSERVREARRHEHNHDALGLWSIALGLLQDAQSKDLLIEQYETSKSSVIRGAAIYGLGLMRDPTVLPEIERALADDSCPFVRGAATTVLAANFGTVATPILAKCAERDHDQTVRRAATFALGGTGDMNAATALFALADKGTPVVRAGAITALGRLLAKQRSRNFAKLGWGSLPADLPATFTYLAELDR
tara:strand:+ start:48964 stop:51099 length:2136 start_codon:yes stop_codon:yes gene_type:complete